MAKKEKKVKEERLEDILRACREQPNDFVVAVNDIKLAILQARARAAQASNVEALKLYFFVGGYISKKTRSAKWGTGAIHALSERLQVELPGLRGFSPSGIKRMRSFYEAWSRHLTIRPTALGEIRHLASDEFGMRSDQDVDERVLSKGLVANIEKTIAALGGNDFCFMGREKRLIVEGEELFIDWLERSGLSLQHAS